MSEAIALFGIGNECLAKCSLLTVLKFTRSVERVFEYIEFSMIPYWDGHEMQQHEHRGVILAIDVRYIERPSAFDTICSSISNARILVQRKPSDAADLRAERVDFVMVQLDRNL